MKYHYGTDDSYHVGSMNDATPDELAEQIKKDVGNGKWNCYSGGRVNSISATCRFKRTGFVYHNRLFIYGSRDEFKVLEGLIKSFMEYFVPRCYLELVDDE